MHPITCPIDFLVSSVYSAKNRYKINTLNSSYAYWPSLSYNVIIFFLRKTAANYLIYGSKQLATI